MANRYQQLLNEVPTGTFYPATGEILPTRSGPYEFRFETSTPNRQYGIFVDNVFRGVVVTNGSGVAIVNIELESGQHVVELVDSTTQEVASGILRLNGNVFWRGAFRAYITVRNYATWMAAHADVFDRVDTQIVDMRNALSLSTVGQLYMGDVYGRGLRQPNDIGFLTDAYRFALQELRQAYRLWGARLAGVREAIAALTDVSPLIVPRAWKPNWVLDGQLLPNGEVGASALVDDDSFPTLNARRFDFVRGSFPDNVTPVLPPYNNPPTPQPLTVRFDAFWAGGNVVIEGFDESSNGISDTFIAAPGSTVLGLVGEYFTELVAIRLTALGAGAGTATVGVAFSRFISLVEARGPLSPTGGAVVHSVNHYSKVATPSLPFDALKLDGGIAAYIVQSGRYAIGGTFGSAGTPAARLPGVAVVAPSLNTVNYGTRDRLSVRVDHLGIVRAPLPAAPDTLANVAAAVNAAIAREVSYGAARSVGSIDVLNPVLLIEGDTITIVDGLAVTGILEADSDNIVANGLNVPFASGPTAAVVALAIRDAIRRSGVRTNADVLSAFPTVAALTSMLGGTSSDVAILTTAAPAALVVAGMGAGADVPAAFASRAAVVSNGVGDILELQSSSSAVGPAAAAEIVPWPIDGAPEVMGFPRERASLNASPAAGTTTLSCADTSRLPRPPVIVLHATLSSAVSPAPGPFTQPDWIAPVEVWFSADYDGGDVVVDGLDCDGGSLLETIEYPGPSVVDSGESGFDRFETGARAANSVGTLAAVQIGGLDGPAAEIRIYNNLNPGAAGNGYSAQIAVGAGINLPLVVALVGVSVNVTLGTDGAGAPDATKNTAALVKAAIEVYQLLAVFTGAGMGVISTVQPPTAFAGGIDDGRVVELTNVAGRPGVETWQPQVRPGMLFRLLSGAYAGQLRRIAYVGREASSYPPASYETLAAEGYGGRVTKICLESSFGTSFWNEEWEIVEPVVAKGTIPFKTISGMSSVTGASGFYQLRIADGVRDYGIPIRVGRGYTYGGASNGGCEPYDPLTGSQEVWPSARFLAGTYYPHPDEIGGVLRIAIPSLANYVNAGAHAIREIEPSQIGVAGGWAFLDHEDWELGAQFAKVGIPAVSPPNPPGSYDWSIPGPETGLTWEVFRAGEVVVMVENDLGSNDVLIAEPGLTCAKITGALVEPTNGLPVRRQALEAGLDQLIVDVDTALAPTALVTTENVTTQDRVIPDGWRAYNVDEANSLYCLWGRTQDLRLRLQHDGGAVLGGDMILEVGVPGGAGYKGQTLRICFWVEQMVSASENFQVDVSFDSGVTWDAGALQAVGLSITDAGALGLGGENPTQVLRDIEVPTDTTAVVVRLRAVGFGAGDQIFLEKAIVTAVNSQGFFLGSGTVARGETQQQFGEVLYVWSPQDLNAAENVGLGLPDRPLIPLSIITRPGHESIVETPGHVDRIVNAHGYWERANISEYSSAAGTLGDPINVIGVHDAAEWLACVLTNMEVGVLSPARTSYARPAAVSLVEGEELTIVGPGSSATLAETSQHEGFFPQHATSREQLYEDGVPVPSTGWPGTRASLAIGPSVGGDVIVTAIDPGKGPENITVEIDNGVGTDRPLHVTFDPGTDAILIELAARDGVLVADENRALMIASAVNDLGPVTAEAVVGNEAVVFAAALAATNLAGAQALPWRFTAANTVEVASTAAGDPVTDANYYRGVVPQDTGLLYYNPTSAYTIDYERLTRAESPVLDLGAAHADYLWLIDAAVYRRVEPAVIERSRTEPLIFYADYTARLSESADQDQNTATLYSDTGIVRAEVDLRNWSFKDATTIQLSPNVFNPDAIYTLEYTAQLGQFPRIASFVLEHRSATTSPGVAAAAWRTVQIDEPVGRITDPAGGVIVHQYHQLRITISNVLDVRDIRVKSMGLKGIHLYGADAYAPGIISCDRE